MSSRLLFCGRLLGSPTASGGNEISLLLSGRRGARTIQVVLSASSGPSTSAESQSSTSSIKRGLVPLDSIPVERLGHSILLSKATLPPGSQRTAHDLVASGVRAAKILSLSSSAAGVVMVPVLSSYLWEAAAERPGMMAFAIVANSFLVLLSFTPLLLHVLTKRFPVDLRYDADTKTFTAVHYSFFLRRKALQFRAEDVLDAAVAPEHSKMWIPLATAFVHGKPFLISLDRNAYVDKLAFDALTQNVKIPVNTD